MVRMDAALLVLLVMLCLVTLSVSWKINIVISIILNVQHALSAERDTLLIVKEDVSMVIDIAQISMRLVSASTAIDCIS